MAAGTLRPAAPRGAGRGETVPACSAGAYRNRIPDGPAVSRPVRSISSTSCSRSRGFLGSLLSRMRDDVHDGIDVIPDEQTTAPIFVDASLPRSEEHTSELQSLRH